MTDSPSATAGYGAGTKDFGDRPNLLRIVVGHASSVGILAKRKDAPAPSATSPGGHGHGHGHAAPAPSPPPAAAPAAAAAAAAPAAAPARVASAAEPPAAAASLSAEAAVGDGLQTQELLQIESNIDDMNPQLFEPVCRGHDRASPKKSCPKIAFNRKMLYRKSQKYPFLIPGSPSS